MVVYMDDSLIFGGQTKEQYHTVVCSYVVCWGGC